MNRKLIAGLLVVALLAGGIVYAALRGTVAPDTAPTNATPAAPVEEQIIATGQVVPAQSAALSFQRGGVLAALLVAEGATVQTGQPLARLDTATQLAQEARAQAQLRAAEANLQQLTDGPRAEDVAAAEAAVRQAQAQLRLTLAAVTPEDIRAAEQQIAAARALMGRLQSGERNPDLRAANAALGQAQAGLEAQRSQLSSAKTSAELQLSQAAEQLVQAQTAYSAARWHWEYVQVTGNDPISPTTPDAANPGKRKDNHLNETQRQQYHDAYISAEAQLHAAEAAMQQAQVAYANARQAEIAGIQASEQSVAGAQATLDRVSGGMQNEDLAQARAQLATAQAGLGRLRGPQREQATAGAQAALDVATASLARLTAAPRTSDRLAAQAQVDAAQAELAAVRAELSNATLAAPFAGVVAGLDLRLSEYVAPGVPVVQLANPAAWLVETTDLTELSVARIAEGSPARLTFDALPGVELRGQVISISGYGRNRQGDIVYKAVIRPAQADARLRWNMTVSVSITAG